MLEFPLKLIHLHWLVRIRKDIEYLYYQLIGVMRHTQINHWAGPESKALYRKYQLFLSNSIMINCW